MSSEMIKQHYNIYDCQKIIERRTRESDLVVIDLIYITTKICIIRNFFLFILWVNYFSTLVPPE